MRLRLSPRAKEDVYEMHEVGSLTFGVRQADAYIESLAATFANIERYPEAARERSEVDPPVRVWPHRAHHICYRIEGDVLWVVRVLHHSMDWTNEL